MLVGPQCRAGWLLRSLGPGLESSGFLRHLVAAFETVVVGSLIRAVAFLTSYRQGIAASLTVTGTDRCGDCLA